LVFERSLRLQPQVVEPRRALFSIPIAELGSAAVDEVLQICRSMSSPEIHCAAIRRFFHAAQFVHFGFEYSGRTIIGKCYLELPFDDQNLAGSATDRLMFLGFKWSINDDTVAVVSRYRSVVVASWAQLVECFNENVPLNFQPAVLNLLNHFQPNKANLQTDLRLLQVVEEGSDRLSYDLNVYNLQRSVSEAIKPIRDMSVAIDCDATAFDNWFSQHKDAIIGHLSAGQSRNGQPFLTVYHSADLNSFASQP
jgi:hypothetical protein